MDSLLNALIQIGPVALFAGLLGALFLYISARVTAGPFIAFAWRVVLVGVVALVVGAAIGIAIFCAPADAGNLCGLGGVFGLGPLLAGLSVVVYAYLRVKAA